MIPPSNSKGAVNPAEIIARLQPPNKKPASGNAFEQLLKSSINRLENNVPGLQGIQMQNHAAQEISEDKFKEILKVVLKHEGASFVKEDGGRGASRFGILESTARELGYKGNIKNISKNDVEALYKKLWDKSGAASLPYPLSLIHFDTYVNSPSAAKKMLEKSGGNIEEYLKIREQRYKRLAELRPERYAIYSKGWANRIKSLRNEVAEYAAIQNFARNENISIKIESRQA
jgi:lysozyme family protein